MSSGVYRVTGATDGAIIAFLGALGLVCMEEKNERSQEPSELRVRVRLTVHEAAKPASAQLPYSYIAKYTDRNGTQREDTPVRDPMVSTRMGLG